MNINFVNDTGFKNLKILVNRAEYTVKRGEKLSILTATETPEIELIPLDKNRVSVLLWFVFGIVDFITDFFVFDDNLIGTVNASSIYNLRLKSDNAFVFLKDLSVDFSTFGGINYIAPYLYSNDAEIIKRDYFLSECKNVKFKFWLTHFIFWSIVLGLGLLLFSENKEAVYYVVGAAFAVFTAFKMRKASKLFSKKYASLLLLKKDEEFRENNNSSKPYEPKTKIGKAFNKRIDRFAQSFLNIFFKDK